MSSYTIGKQMANTTFYQLILKHFVVCSLIVWRVYLLPRVTRHSRAYTFFFCSSVPVFIGARLELSIHPQILRFMSHIQTEYASDRGDVRVHTAYIIDIFLGYFSLV